ncbi:MAG: M48 family metallopeptidase [Bacteroidales bacterium]|nr:M48 family metallopeptidase [Bacteroidales bacterium]MBK7626153.1 M48 family metallopeptidase [Bacteroidales bacterium]
MQTAERTGTIKDIDFKVVYSRRRTLGISVHPDSTVIVRVPYRTSDKTIVRIVEEKAEWIIKHRDNYRKQNNNISGRSYCNGDIHLYRGREAILSVINSTKPFAVFTDGKIEIGVARPEDQKAVRRVLYSGYKREATELFPVLLGNMLSKHEDQNFKPAGLIIRSMKRRWGSCSFKGVITLSTELIKLPDLYIEYVIVHELCHLKHHNHGAKYYELLSELFPEWKSVRKELRKHIR